MVVAVVVAVVVVVVDNTISDEPLLNLLLLSQFTQVPCVFCRVGQTTTKQQQQKQQKHKQRNNHSCLSSLLVRLVLASLTSFHGPLQR